MDHGYRPYLTGAALLLRPDAAGALVDAAATEAVALLAAAGRDVRVAA